MQYAIKWFSKKWTKLDTTQTPVKNKILKAYHQLKSNWFHFQIIKLIVVRNSFTIHPCVYFLHWLILCFGIFRYFYSSHFITFYWSFTCTYITCVLASKYGVFQPLQQQQQKTNKQTIYNQPAQWIKVHIVYSSKF